MGELSSVGLVELGDAMRLHAERFGVTPAIASNDYMYLFLKTMNAGSDIIASEQYFMGGAHDADQILGIMAELGVARTGLAALEFAAGYGRVTRHLKGKLGSLHLLSVDIHSEAVSFIKNNIGTNAAVSNSIPENIEVSGQFDFIFALSFFSHLPDHNFSRWLRAIYGLLAPGGYFLFTTHGEPALKKVEFLQKGFDETSGFGFQLSSEQNDLEVTEYGTTVSLPKYIISAIYRATNARIIRFCPGVWFGLQDEWIIQKPT